MDSRLSISNYSNAKERVNVEILLKRNIPNLLKNQNPLAPEEFNAYSDYHILRVENWDAKVVAAVIGAVPTIIYNAKLEKAQIKNLKYESKIRELDFIAVDARYRKNGLATELLSILESKYKEDGVEVIFGNFNDEKNKELLSKFYKKNGYKLVDEMPNFFDIKWESGRLPSDKPTSYFYKQL